MNVYTLEEQEAIRNAFGKNLSDIMYEKHISQTKMANELKTPKTTISGWINGKRIPRAASIEKVCKYLNCSQADLFKIRKLSNAFSENDGDKTNTFNLSSEAVIAEKIAGSYDLRSLFDAAIVSRPEDIRLVAETLRRMNRDMP